MRKKQYDYVGEAKRRAWDEHWCEGWRGMTVKRILRRLVREAVLSVSDIDNAGENLTYDEMADRIAKKLIP